MPIMTFMYPSFLALCNQSVFLVCFSDQTAINNASCPSYFHPHLRHKSTMDTDFPPAIKLVLPCGAASKRHKIEATKDTYDSVPPKDPYYSDKNRKKEKRRGCILSVVYHPSRDWNLHSFPPRYPN